MEGIGTLIIIAICFLLYFLPTVIGWRKKNVTAIFVLNLFLGWTFIGWIVALVWACTQDAQPTIINNNLAATTPTVANSVDDQLNILNKMREMGKITNDEYWEERKRLELL